MQRVPSLAVSRRVHDTWHEAVAGAPSCVTPSMTGVDGAAVVQHGRPQRSPSAQGGMSAARCVELVLSTRRRRSSFPIQRQIGVAQPSDSAVKPK
jgi:hypothetical protein